MTRPYARGPDRATERAAANAVEARPRYLRGPMPRSRPSSSPFVACLLPVRDGERELAGWFASVKRFADAVVALDDGSTDGTGAMLEAEPLVRIVLRNPPRPSAAAWDDGENRRRLLDSAGGLRPSWIVFLDVDERLDAADAQTLR